MSRQGIDRGLPARTTALNTAEVSSHDDRLRVGFLTTSAPDQVRALESLGIDSLWVGGHIVSPTGLPEVMIRLARLATVSERVQVGSAALVLPLYPPFLVAKQIADLDDATGGRVNLGVGVGGEYEEEFRAVDIPTRERGARLDEAIPLVRAAWTGEPVHHEGRFYRVRDVRLRSRPARGDRIPIVVTGRSAAAMRRAAHMGDGWMPYFYSVRNYRESVLEITKAAADAGRNLDDFAWYTQLFVLVDDDVDRGRERAATALSARFQGVPGQDFRPLVDRIAAVGTTDDIASRVRDYVDAGVRHIVFAPLEVDDVVPCAERIMREVVPSLDARP